MPVDEHNHDGDEEFEDAGCRRGEPSDTPILLPSMPDKELITISADGNRFALSFYNHNTADI